MVIETLPIFVAILVVLSVSGLTAVLFTTLLHHLVHPARTDENAQLCANLSTRLGALQALILALAFNTVFSEYNELSESIDQEAVVISLVLEDLSEELPAENALASVATLANYVYAVLEEDWITKEPLASNLTADLALYDLRRLLDDMPTSPAITETVREIDQLLDEIDRLRMQRLVDYDDDLPPLFWELLIALYFLALLPISYFKQTKISACYIASYGMAIGIVMYAILLYSQPFQTSLKVENQPFVRILHTIENEYAKIKSSLDDPDDLRLPEVKSLQQPKTRQK
ncbi:hypothetical protein A3K86_04435 [Photobacterium jeanii]|uniref:DUF4239 domain-containing protein n=1 Tax=Photobacterium jeanii TaxID=858640 RepID=A0A178KN20_9GAMM|nr:DUF4239 domain-containing protein [Photobacterium jeanii]OAN18154.1 hypothetical protein A3K86_04435 [Photobacterium jeanii]PST92170.1 DUF4239 domain-containing protein [Photobacterium jeanii]